MDDGAAAGGAAGGTGTAALATFGAAFFFPDIVDSPTVLEQRYRIAYRTRNNKRMKGLLAAATEHSVTHYWATEYSVAHPVQGNLEVIHWL